MAMWGLHRRGAIRRMGMGYSTWRGMCGSGATIGSAGTSISRGRAWIRWGRRVGRRKWCAAGVTCVMTLTATATGWRRGREIRRIARRGIWDSGACEICERIAANRIRNTNRLTILYLKLGEPACYSLSTREVSHSCATYLDASSHQRH